MAQTPRLELRQGTALVMTPQLQQSIKLLQLSSLDLAEFVDDELRTNPLLERADAEWGSGTAAGPADAEPAQFEADDGFAPEAGSGDESFAAASANRQDGREGSGLANLPAQARNLRDHLVEQLNVDIEHPMERLIGMHLIDALDEAGYLATPLPELAERLGSDLERIEAVLRKVQRFDPPGVFARNLCECLKLQLEDRNRLDPAMAALVENLELVAEGAYAKLKRLCGVTDEDLKDMLAELRSLAPKPGLAFDGGIVEAIVPDVLMKTAPGGGWMVELNSATLPRVLVDTPYYARLKEDARNKAEQAYIAERYQAANWLVKALDQRARTILKVARELVRQQEDFFRHGVERLRPLILKDIAQTVGVHESTVSRVINNKYMLTPRGTFELKYFFSASLEAADGGPAHSAEAVRHRIRRLIEKEDPARPLSDDRLAHMLNAQGIGVARRTIAKYRESMHLGSSVERRRLKLARAGQT